MPRWIEQLVVGTFGVLHLHWSYVGFLTHRDTPSHHAPVDGIFDDIPSIWGNHPLFNGMFYCIYHPAMGVPHCQGNHSHHFNRHELTRGFVWQKVEKKTWFISLMVICPNRLAMTFPWGVPRFFFLTNQHGWVSVEFKAHKLHLPTEH